MNWLKQIKKLINGFLVILTLGLFSCVNENFSEPDSPEPENPSQEKVALYAVLRLNIEESGTTRSIFDADYDDTGGFNKGLEFERALYFPSNNSPGSDEDEDLSQEIYHFAILVDENGDIFSRELLSLEPLTGPDEEKDGTYTVYTRFFTPADRVNVFKEFEGTVYVVLNASHSLVETVKEKLTHSNPQLDEITRLVLTKGSTSADDFLYLKNRNGAYITDKNGNRYFTMSSSMIIKEGKVVPAIDGGKKEDNEEVIPAFTIYSDLDEAKENPTSIYVERLQAKYTVLFKKDENNSYYISFNGGVSGDVNAVGPYIPVRGLFIYPNKKPKTIQYVTSYTRSEYMDNRNIVEVKTTDKWKVNIVGWSVNGIEQEEYLFKNLTPSGDYTSGNSWFQPSTTDNFRNFWSEDPNYSGGYYPDQYRKSTDDTSQTVEAWNENATLKYFSFDDLSKRNLRNYTPENTFTPTLLGDDPINSKSHLRVGSHIIVTAQLIIIPEEDNGINFEHAGIATSTTVNSQGLLVSGMNGVKSKFLMNDIYWDELAYKDYVVEYLGYWMLTAENQEDENFGENDGYFYDNEQGVKARGASFDVEQVNLKGTDNMVWLKPNKTLYTYNPSTRKYKELDLVKYKKLFFEHQNYFAQRLLDGRMYYAEPTYHNLEGYYQDRGNIATGDFGTVRNNWYSYTIDFISAPGTPVSTPDQPIIPNNDPTVSGMGVSMKLIDWHREIINVGVGGQNRPGSSK